MFKVVTIFLCLITTVFAKSIQLNTLNFEAKSINLCTDIITRAYKRIGYSVTIMKFPSKRSIFYSTSGIGDGELCRPEQLVKYKSLLKIPTPILKMKLMAYSQSKIPIPKSFEELKKYKIAFVASAYGNLLVERGLTKYIEGHDIPQLFKLVKHKRVDLGIIFDVEGDPYHKQFKYKYDLTQIFGDFKLFHYLHTKNKEILPLISKEIRRLK